MKGKKLAELFGSKRVWRAGSVLLAAVVLGAGAWNVNTTDNSEVPELTAFVDMEEMASIEEEEAPLASAPKVTTTTKTTTKVVTLKKKATRTYTRKLTPKTVNSPTVTKTSGSTKTTTKKQTTTYVTEKYKKNSKKKTVVTVKRVKTTVTTTTVKKATTATASKTSSAAVKTAAATTTQTSAKKSSPYTVSVSSIAPLLDSRVLKAYQTLNFGITINSTVSYSGYFDARNQSITLREESDTIYHEMGHFVAFIAGNVDTKADFAAIYQAEKSKFTGSRKVYAVQNASEFFAECFREYTLNPTTLKKTCPKTYAAITSALNKVTDSQIAQLKLFYGSIWTK